jgi:RimJ/RimL family protein N-acetyltransferase
VLPVPPVLRDGDLVLRPLRSDDAADFVRAFREDPQLGVWLGADADPTEDEVRERATRERPVVELTIADAAGGAFLGTVIAHHIEPDHGRAEIGFWLAPWAHGERRGRRAVRLFVGWLFDGAGLRRVELSTTSDNGAARALATDLGFTEEGTMRARDIERGRAVDIVWFGVLRDEWRAQGAST